MSRPETAAVIEDDTPDVLLLLDLSVLRNLGGASRANIACVLQRILVLLRYSCETCKLQHLLLDLRAHTDFHGTLVKATGKWQSAGASAPLSADAAMPTELAATCHFHGAHPCRGPHEDNMPRPAGVSKPLVLPSERQGSLKGSVKQESASCNGSTLNSVERQTRQHRQSKNASANYREQQIRSEAPGLTRPHLLLDLIGSSHLTKKDILQKGVPPQHRAAPALTNPLPPSP
jgi:hypothetical protein